MKLFHLVFDGVDGTKGVTTDKNGTVIDGTHVFARAFGKNLNDLFRIYLKDGGRLPIFHHATRNEYGHYFVGDQLWSPLTDEAEEIFVELTCKTA